MEKNHNHSGLNSNPQSTDEEIKANATPEKTTTSDAQTEMPEKHHQEHGNRKYKMFDNHSSADDQPRTDTGTP